MDLKKLVLCPLCPEKKSALRKSVRRHLRDIHRLSKEEVDGYVPPELCPSTAERRKEQNGNSQRKCRAKQREQTKQQQEEEGDLSKDELVVDENGIGDRQPKMRSPPLLPTAQTLITQLNLTPHPEGGHYTETYRASQTHHHTPISTSIHFLLHHHPANPDANIYRSKLHKLTVAETFYLHPSTHPATLIELHNLDVKSDEKKPEIKIITLGWDITQNHVTQHTFSPGVWFGAFTNAQLNDEEGYTLVGCNCSPGFSAEVFQMIDQRPDVRQRVVDVWDGSDMWEVLERVL